MTFPTKYEFDQVLSKKPGWKELYQAVLEGLDERINSIVERNQIDLRENRLYTRILLKTAIQKDKSKVLDKLFEKNAKIGGILFTAVRENAFECVKTIVEQFEKKKEDGDLGPIQTREKGFVTPMMMAIHSNYYDIIEYFIVKKYKIEEPKDEKKEVKYTSNKDKLAKTAKSFSISTQMAPETKCPDEHMVMFKINTYQAIANPLYISYMFIHDKNKVNPLYEIFRLNEVLRQQSRLDVEFKEEYKKESKKCDDFAVGLIEQCRTFNEIQMLTNMNPEFEKKEKHVQVESKHEDAKALTFLNQAIKGGNEKLVAHPSSQLCLNMVLYRDIYTLFKFEPNWRDMGMFSTFLYMVRHALLLPFLAIVHIVAPITKVTEMLKNPMIKYFSHFWYSLFFVVLLIVAAFQDTFDKNVMKPSIPEWLILVWLLGMIVQESKEMWTEGCRRYFKQWWNTVTIVMICFFMASYLLRLIAYAMTGSWGVLAPLKEDLEPSSWYKIILLSNSFFSMGMLLSFVVLSAAFQMNDFLGPFQFSVYRLILDVFKFMVFFALIFVAFAFSLRKLYSHYISTQRYMAESGRSINGTFNASSPETNHPFSNADTGFISLFWSLFGMADLSDFSTKDKTFAITKETGETLYAVFLVVAILVVINMLIAMMSNSYQEIADHAIMKWKVSRTRLMMFWVEKGSVLPPPLNLIPNVYEIVRALQKRCKDSSLENATDDQELQEIVSKRNKKIKTILKRYISELKMKERKAAQDGDGGD